MMCEKPNGQQYCKSVEVAPDGNYLASHLTDVNEATYLDLRSQANPNHLVAPGWSAIPTYRQRPPSSFAAVGAGSRKIPYAQQPA